MTGYLKRFQSQSHFKVSEDLIGRWEFDARYHGDYNIKMQIANAKRTATSLEKARSQFSNLRPEHELAINAAAGAMRALALELAPLATWAKSYKVFCEAEYKKDRAAELEAIATQRWGMDDAKFQFEAALIKTLTMGSGGIDMGRWMQSRGVFVGLREDRIFSPFSSGFMQERSDERMMIAEKIEEARRVSRSTDRDGIYGHCSWADYEAYLAFRREMAKTTALIVQMAGNA